MTKPADDFDLMERLAAGLLSFKHMSPYAKGRFHTDLTVSVASIVWQIAPLGACAALRAVTEPNAWLLGRAMVCAAMLVRTIANK